MKTVFIVLLCFCIIACKKNENVDSHNTVTLNLNQKLEISSKDTLKVNLGAFGNEEGAAIINHPENAEISMLTRNSPYIFYKYYAGNNFRGNDTTIVSLITKPYGSLGNKIDTAVLIIKVN